MYLELIKETLFKTWKDMGFFSPVFSSIYLLIFI